MPDNNKLKSFIAEGLLELQGHKSEFPISYSNKLGLRVNLMPDVKTARSFIEQSFIMSDATVTEFKWFASYEPVAEWLTDNETKGLILIGSTGTGKSRILNSTIPIAFSMLQPNGIIIQPVTSYDLSATNFRRLLEKQYISIDEIGRECIGNDFGSKFEMLEIIADHCEKHGKLFFATTNFTYKQLIERYGEPCIMRLRKLCKWVEVVGDNMRSK